MSHVVYFSCRKLNEWLRTLLLDFFLLKRHFWHWTLDDANVHYRVCLVALFIAISTDLAFQPPPVPPGAQVQILHSTYYFLRLKKIVGSHLQASISHHWRTQGQKYLAGIWLQYFSIPTEKIVAIAPTILENEQF